LSLRDWWAEYSKELNTSAELINELIAITTEYEETIYNIGRESYTIYKKNQIFDVVTVDLCRRIDADLEHLQKQAKDEAEFEALVTGISEVPPKGASAVSIKLRQQANNYFQGREKSALQGMMRDHYDEVGRRVFSDNSITNSPRIRRMVLYATHVKADQEAKWKQIEGRNSELARGPGFHALAGYFVLGMVRFVHTTFLSGWVRSAKDYQVQIRNRVKQGYKGVHYDSSGSGSDTGRVALPADRPGRAPEASPVAPSVPKAPSAPMASVPPTRSEEANPGFTGGGNTGFGKKPASAPQAPPLDAEGNHPT
jgi:hypothetical protein